MLLQPALIIGVFSYVLSMSIVRATASKFNYAFDANQELVALGVSNLVGSCFGSYPVSGSLSRSMLVATAGGREVTPMHGVVSASLVLLVLLLLTPLFANLPYAVLASIVFMAVRSLIDPAKPRALAATSLPDLALWTIGFVTTIVFGVKPGIGAAFLSSMGMVVLHSMSPSSALLGRLPHTAFYVDLHRHPEAEVPGGVAIFTSYDAALHFANKDRFRERLKEEMRRARRLLSAAAVASAAATAAGGGGGGSGSEGGARPQGGGGAGDGGGGGGGGGDGGAARNGHDGSSGGSKGQGGDGQPGGGNGDNGAADAAGGDEASGGGGGATGSSGGGEGVGEGGGILGGGMPSGVAVPKTPQHAGVAARGSFTPVAHSPPTNGPVVPVWLSPGGTASRPGTPLRPELEEAARGRSSSSATEPSLSSGGPLTAVVLVLSHVRSLDATVARMLLAVHEELVAVQLQLIVCGCEQAVLSSLRGAGLIDAIGERNVFDDLHAAVCEAQARAVMGATEAGAAAAQGTAAAYSRAPAKGATPDSTTSAIML